MNNVIANRLIHPHTVLVIKPLHCQAIMEMRDGKCLTVRSAFRATILLIPYQDLFHLQ